MRHDVGERVYFHILFSPVYYVQRPVKSVFDAAAFFFCTIYYTHDDVYIGRFERTILNGLACNDRRITTKTLCTYAELYAVHTGRFVERSRILSKLSHTVITTT